MTPPTSYTEQGLLFYMLAELGSVATTLNLDEIDFSEAINDTILAYGVTAIAACVDIPKTRAIAKVMAWRKIASEVTADYDFTDGDATFNRSQLQAQVLKRLQLAEVDALPYMLSYSAKVITLSLPNNPYKRPANENIIP